MYKGNWKFKKTHAHPLTMARNPVILLCPEDIRARPNHQPTMHSHKNLQVSVIIIYYSYKNILEKFIMDLSVKKN